MRMDFSVVEAGTTSYVHLLNPSIEPSLCCGMMDIYDGAFERSYEYMEETVPVHDLRIRLHGGRVVDAQALREKSPVRVSEVDGAGEIAVDRVALWEVIRVQTAGRAAAGGR